MMPSLQSFGIKFAFAALLLVAVYGWHRLEVSRSYSAGQLNERIVWQERAARDQIKRDADRKAAQATIDKIEREYWEKQTNDAINLASLETALKEEQANEKVSGTCGPAVSKRVRDAINAIGRD
ncbi:hypothetical protein [Pararhizobium sp.]|uniref:hypothetical protein n=1 Tax=Pararhizobium sp. TaxID=1977563 RepID=UPI002720D1F0|nr:hypothetical protein [Pararhizobium sp.]MDO9417051.1 hypothetical protein [Pararhizobium sp.]